MELNDVQNLNGYVQVAKMAAHGISGLRSCPAHYTTPFSYIYSISCDERISTPLTEDLWIICLSTRLWIRHFGLIRRNRRETE